MGAICFYSKNNSTNRLPIVSSMSVESSNIEIEHKSSKVMSNNAQNTYVFKIHGSLDKGKAKVKPKEFVDQMCETTQEEIKKIGGRVLTSLAEAKAKNLIGNKTKTDSSKSPVTIKSQIVNRMPTNKFQVGPAQFRCENKRNIEEQYEVLEVIGKGSFGEVKKIRDRETGELRALKVMQKKSCQMTKEFSDEIQILQKLVKTHYIQAGIRIILM